jgi:hypothetical protein
MELGRGKNNKKNELFELSGNDVREYFKFSVRMSAKPIFGSYTIFIDDTQRTKHLMLAILVPRRWINTTSICGEGHVKIDLRCKSKGMESF